MNKLNIAKAVALALLGAAGFAAAPAFAGTATLTANATLNVTGVLSPGACTVSFNGGGAIDYGTIQDGNLSKVDYTALSEQAKELSVACGGNIHAYVSVSDNRAASAITADAMKNALGNSALANTQVFGLGQSGGANIGTYTIKMGPATVANAAGNVATQAAVLSSSDKSVWTASTSPVYMAAGASQYYSAGAAAAGSTPVAGKNFTFPLTIKAALNNTTDLQTSSNVALDGSATFTVSYN